MFVQEAQRQRAERLKAAMDEAQMEADRMKHAQRMKRLQQGGHDTAQLHAKFEGQFVGLSYINGLVQDHGNYSVSAMELLQSCTKQSIYIICSQDFRSQTTEHTMRHFFIKNVVAVAAYSRLASRSQAKFHTKKLSPLVRPCAAAPAQSTTSAHRSLRFSPR